MQSSLEQEKYFQESFEWFFRKYLIPLNEISVLIILNIFASFIFLVICWDVLALFSFDGKQKNFINGNYSNADKQVKFFNISKRENVENSFFQIIAENYIKKIESYDFTNLKKQIDFVQNNSSSEVLQKFLQYIDNKNPSSPILRYFDLFTKEVEILQINNISNNNIKAIIQTKAFSLNGTLIELLDYEIQLSYISNFQLIKKNYENNQINFTVTDYKQTLLKVQILE
ncbi:MAG: hypothetical protein ISN64_01110 [Rickettsia sp.]|nr:hypothetical protein [Rickettsia sp.]